MACRDSVSQEGLVNQGRFPGVPCCRQRKSIGQSRNERDYDLIHEFYMVFVPNKLSHMEKGFHK